MNTAINPWLTQVGHAMRRHARVIRRLQWAVVLYRGTRPHAAINTFKYSIYYLFLLFIALLVDHYLMLNL